MSSRYSLRATPRYVPLFCFYLTLGLFCFALFCYLSTWMGENRLLRRPWNWDLEYARVIEPESLAIYGVHGC